MSPLPDSDPCSATDAEAINLALRDHQQTAAEWRFSKLTEDLHCWAERMNLQFKLETPVPTLTIQRLRRKYGHFRPGRNGFGLKDEIAIDENHAQQSPYWRVLGTLSHELLHCWQEHHGRPGRGNYHNKEFRRKALSLGLIIDALGHTQYQSGDTPFFNLLRKFGVEPPEILAPQQALTAGRGSRLKLYKCPCGVKVRVGRSRFNAKCLDCGGLFKQMDPRPARVDDRRILEVEVWKATETELLISHHLAAGTLEPPGARHGSLPLPREPLLLSEKSSNGETTINEL